MRHPCIAHSLLLARIAPNILWQLGPRNDKLSLAPHRLNHCDGHSVESNTSD